MPRYTPVDPSLVAMNPGAITQGAGQALQLAQALDQIRAYRAHQQELADTRLKRVQAANVGADVSIAKGNRTLEAMPLVSEVEDLRLGNERALLPLQGKRDVLKTTEDLASIPVIAAADRAGAQYRTQEATTMMPQLALLAETKGKQAKAAGVEADIAVSTGPARMEIAQAAAEFAKATVPIEQKIKMFQLQDQMENAKSDADVARIQREVGILLQMSQIGENDAQARYLGSGGGRQGKSLVDQEKDILEAIANVEKRFTGSGETTTVYESNTYKGGKPPGTMPKVIDGFWTSPKRVDPIGEIYIAQRNALLQDLQRVRGQIQQSAPAPTSTQQASTGRPTVTSKAAYDGLPSGTEFIGGDGKVYRKP